MAHPRNATIENIPVMKQVTAAIREMLPDADIILYGSRARGDARLDSDWDLLVLTDQPVTIETEEALWDHLYPIEVANSQVVSAFVKNRGEWKSQSSQASPYHQAIECDGIPL